MKAKLRPLQIHDNYISLTMANTQSLYSQQDLQESTHIFNITSIASLTSTLPVKWMRSLNKALIWL